VRAPRPNRAAENSCNVISLLTTLSSGKMLLTPNYPKKRGGESWQIETRGGATDVGHASIVGLENDPMTRPSNGAWVGYLLVTTGRGPSEPRSNSSVTC
jgi:hypothetical protein